MKKTAVLISELASALFLAAVWCAFFYMCVFIAGTEGARLSPVWPALLFIVVYAVDRLARNKGMRVLLYIVLQIVLAAAGSAVLELAVSLPSGSVGLRAYMAVFFAITVVICARTTEKDPAQPTLMHRFDIGIILAAVMLLLDHFMPQSVMHSCLFMTVLSLLVILAGLTALRTEKNSAVGSGLGKVLPFILLAVIARVAAGIAVFLSGGAGSITAAFIAAVGWVFGSIGKGLGFLWTQWTRFCAWIATLFPEGEPGGGYIENPEMPVNIEHAEEASKTSIVVLYVLTGLLVAAVLFLIIRRLRNVRFKKRAPRAIMEKDAVRTGSFGEGLRTALGILAQKLRYRLDCIRYRNTPAGLLAWCERKVKRASKKLPSESGSAFLLRLAESRAEEEKQALQKLAELVERSFYSKIRTNADVALCRAVRRCRF